MDVRLIPMLALLYLLSFLDRGNIGNAKIEGLQEDLKMEASQYNWCLTVFFFSYAAFEVPSNLLLKKLRPSRWLPIIMVAWGIVMTLMGIVQNYHGLLIARIFLGVAEAGLFPGVAVRAPFSAPSRSRDASTRMLTSHSFTLLVLSDDVVLSPRNPASASSLLLGRLHCWRV
jgi:MFS family permease